MEKNADVTQQISQVQVALNELNYKMDRLQEQRATATAYNTVVVEKKDNGSGAMVRTNHALDEPDDFTTDFSKDENEERGNWSGRLDFLLSCLGYAVGLGNVWRFPYLCYRNGGGAFFIPYCIFLFFVGIPIFFLELSLGQFTSSGPFTCWKFAPVFTGIGVGMVIVSGLVAIYYNMIIAWSIYYLCASFTTKLPWESCPEDRSSDLCIDRVPDWDLINCTETPGLTPDFTTGLCLNGTKKIGLFNATALKLAGLKRRTAAEEYLEYVALGTAHSTGIDDLGPIRWDMALCLLLGWLIVYFSLIKGVKSSGKVVYFTALFPYVVLVILLIRAVLLEGHLEGVKFYLTPDLSRLADSLVWKDAAVQIFFSLSASWGGLITLASYNRYHNDCLRDTLIVALGNCLTSFFAGFVIFSFLGFLAHELKVDISEVATSGVGLAFVVYPEAVKNLPIPALWSILFFSMLITLGLDSQFALVETVSTAFFDRWPALRRHKAWFLLGLAAIFYCIGLCMCTNGGAMVLELMDTYAGGWNVLLIALFECISLGWVYGFKRFRRDIGTMLGHDFCGCLPWYPTSWWWAICWCFITPALVLFIMIFSWVQYKPIKYNDYVYPTWAEALGWCMTISVVLGIFVTGILVVLCQSGDCVEKFNKSFTPTNDWGPALVKHRRLVDYVPGFVVDPWGNEELGRADALQMTSIKHTGDYDNAAFESETKNNL